MGGLDFRGGGEPRHRFAVIGFPWDFGAALGRPGARYAPAKIREAAGWSLARVRDEQIWDVEVGDVVDLSGLVIEDRGDVEIASHDREATFARARQATAEALHGGVVPIVLGGDHSISLPPIEALGGLGPFEIGRAHG